MNIYQEKGYKDRKDYLESLAENFGMEYESVAVLADTLGELEDFDGLIVVLEDNYDWEG